MCPHTLGHAVYNVGVEKNSLLEVIQANKQLSSILSATVCQGLISRLLMGLVSGAFGLAACRQFPRKLFGIMSCQNVDGPTQLSMLQAIISTDD